VTVSLVLLIVMAVLYACGVYLLLERSMTKVLIGFLLVGNATNLLILVVAGPPGAPPIDTDSLEGISDPLPQALTLTAIVITFAVSAFLLALIYRSWRLAQADELQDDADALALRDAELDESELLTDTSDDSEFDDDHGRDA